LFFLLICLLTLNHNDISQPAGPNVIVFGETGAGKSSVVNMLQCNGEANAVANTSSDVSGTTFRNTLYPKIIQDLPFNVFDTVGLNEASGGTVPAVKAIQALYELIEKLGDGVSLLVYVMRASRITEIVESNYKLFHDIFCAGKVPIVIVITGLENEEDMDAWWPRNEGNFSQHNMSFQGSACITATRGLRRGDACVFDEEYENSKLKVEELIVQSVSKDPWRMPRANWFAVVLVRVRNFFAKIFNFTPIALAATLYEALITYGGLSPKAAFDIANDVK
jgi:hypothetical protein